jgi:TonB family protein
VGSFIYSFFVHLILLAVVSASIGSESDSSQVVHVQLLSDNEAKQNSIAVTSKKSRKKTVSKTEPTVNLGQNSEKTTEELETLDDTIANLHQLSQKGDSVFGYLLNLIYKNRIYPYESIRLKQQGKVSVSFYINENGEVADVKLLESCGYKNLDLAAIKTLKGLKIDKNLPKIEKLFSRKYSLIFDFKITKTS